MTVVVAPCASPRRFLDAQRAFYRDDPHYVPPFTWYDRHQVDRGRNPFFEHAESEFWLAHDGRTCVGRISATRDAEHDAFHGDRVGFFGHFEARDELVARQLLDTAAAWLRAHGAESLRGPVDLSTNYKCGLLIGGEPGPPFVTMPHNPPEYAEWLEAYGLAKAKDLVALMLLAENADMTRFERIAGRVRKRFNPEIRQLDPRNFEAELEMLWRLYVTAWEKNWGFAPMTESEFRAEAANFRQVLRPELTVIATVDGEPAGMALGVPNVNVAIKACNGRLLPFGFLKFVRALERVRTFRTLTLGVMPEFRGTGFDALVLAELVRSGPAHGFATCEASWILEDNANMLRPLELMGGHEYRRYRIYEKALSV